MKKLSSLLLVVVAMMFINPLLTFANDDFFYSDIDYGTSYDPIQYAIALNNDYDNLDEFYAHLRKGNNATQHAKILNSFTNEEIMEFYYNLNDNLMDEADMGYYGMLLREYLLNK